MYSLCILGIIYVSGVERTGVPGQLRDTPPAEALALAGSAIGWATGAGLLGVGGFELVVGFDGGPPLCMMIHAHTVPFRPTAYRRGVGGVGSAALRGVLTARSPARGEGAVFEGVRCCCALQGEAFGPTCLPRLETVGTKRRSTDGVRRRGEGAALPSTVPSSEVARLPPCARQLAATRESARATVTAVALVAVRGTMWGASSLPPGGACLGANGGAPSGLVATQRTNGSGVALVLVASDLRDSCPAERGVVELDAP